MLKERAIVYCEREFMSAFFLGVKHDQDTFTIRSPGGPEVLHGVLRHRGERSARQVGDPHRAVEALVRFLGRRLGRHQVPVEDVPAQGRGELGVARPGHVAPPEFNRRRLHPDDPLVEGDPVAGSAALRGAVLVPELEGDVGPGLAEVLAHLEVPVIGAGPEDARLDR